MTLFLDNIFQGVSPSTVLIKFPVVYKADSGNEDGSGMTSLYGLLTSEVSMSTQNKWGPILNDISNIQDISSLLGETHMWSWIGASTLCWKGTEPLKTSFEFFLINYRKELYLEHKLTQLNYLTSLFNIDKNIAVKVHGGYAAQVLESNKEKFFNNEAQNRGESVLGDFLSPFGELANTFGDNDEETVKKNGTVSVYVGNKFYLSKMLVSRLDVAPSLVELPDGLPLYYKVSISLTGTQPLLSTDVDRMYNSAGK